MSHSRPISVVVPTRDRPDLLDECLTSLRKAVRPSDEIIVADSASSTPVVRQVADAHGVQYLRCNLPGASRARNAGWRTARHEVVAFIDDDVRVDEGWAEGIARAFGDPGVAFVTGRIAAEGRGGSPVARKIETSPARLDGDTSGIIGHSANLGARRRALEYIGGFDERLGAGATFKAAEDLDLFDRLLGAGYVGRYEPQASSTHQQWRRHRDYVRLQGAYGVGSGARLAKLLRSDAARAGRMARAELVDHGLRPLVRALRRRSWAGVAARLLRLGGVFVGLGGGFLYGLTDGHLAGRIGGSPNGPGHGTTTGGR